MRVISKVLLIIIPILVISAFFVMDFSKESEITEKYQVGLSEIKKQYVIGEDISFSLFLTGYGNECGSYEILLKKNDRIIESKSIDIDCNRTASKDFDFVNIDIITLDHTLLESGDYVAKGEFSKNEGQNFQYEKTFIVT